MCGDLSTFQAGLALRPEQCAGKRIDGASPTLTPQSSCGELESCEEDASGRTLPAWLQSGDRTTRQRAKQSSQAVPAWLAAQAPTDRRAALRARGENVRTSMVQAPRMPRRSQLRTLAANLPAPHQQDLYAAHHQPSAYSEHQMDAARAYAALVQEAASEAMCGKTEAVIYAAFQQGWLYGRDLQSDAVVSDMPMKIRLDGLFALEAASFEGLGGPLTLAPPPGL